MTIGSKEFYDLMDQFEKDIKNMRVYGCKVEREDKTNWKNQNYYSNGQVNLLFQGYIFGYSYARCLANQG